MLSPETSPESSHETNTAIGSQRELDKFSIANNKQANQKSCDYALWYALQDWGQLTRQRSTLRQSQYNTLLLNSDLLAEFGEQDTSGFQIAFELTQPSHLQSAVDALGNSFIAVSENESLLAEAKAKKHPTARRCYVDSSDSLHEAIAVGKHHDYLMIRFRDPTNIPLELVIASLQASGTVLINEIESSAPVENAFVVLGVMEYGADGILYSPDDDVKLRELGNSLDNLSAAKQSISIATITRSVPVGMGFRSCIDLAALFEPDEGMVIGSTSHGGILCCPEVFHLPYMELRPFRVNAGGIHSYVYGPHGQTSYLSELKAGSQTMIVGLDGKSRHAVVGRIKTEVRPLRLIEATFESGQSINTIMQDDWHVRIFSSAGGPLNVTELKTGDEILAMESKSGRHVGIAIDENIIEV